MPLLRRVIGAVLRKVRQGQGRTLREVAAAAGVSLPYLSEVERGTKEASSEILAAICRALGLAMPDLLEQARKEMIKAVVSAPVARRAQGPRCAIGRTMICARGGQAVTMTGVPGSTWSSSLR